MRSFKSVIHFSYTVFSSVYRALKSPTGFVTLLYVTAPFVQAAFAEDDISPAPNVALSPYFSSTLSAEFVRPHSVSQYRFGEELLVSFELETIKSAIDKNDIDTLRYIFDTEPDSLKFKISKHQLSPWFYAIRLGRLDVVRLINENQEKWKFDVNISGKQSIVKEKKEVGMIGETPALIHACALGHLPIIKFFYDQGFFEKKYEGRNLGVSCIVDTLKVGNHAQVISELKNWGVDFNKIMAAPLAMSLEDTIREETIFGVKALLIYGLDPNLAFQNITLFERVVRAADPQLVNAFLKKNADITKLDVDAVKEAISTVQAAITIFVRQFKFACRGVPIESCAIAIPNPTTKEIEINDARNLVYRMKTFPVLFQYQYDINKSNLAGESTLDHLANFLNQQLPNRHAPNTVKNNFDKLIYERYVKRFFADFLTAIEERSQQFNPIRDASTNFSNLFEHYKAIAGILMLGTALLYLHHSRKAIPKPPAPIKVVKRKDHLKDKKPHGNQKVPDLIIPPVISKVKKKKPSRAIVFISTTAQLNLELKENTVEEVSCATAAAILAQKPNPNRMAKLNELDRLVQGRRVAYEEIYQETHQREVAESILAELSLLRAAPVLVAAPERVTQQPLSPAAKSF